MSTRIPLHLLLLGSLLCSISIAQQTAAPPADLKLNVVVTGKNGVPVPGLQKKDFTLFDNKAVQPITSFRALGKEAPVEVILVVDAVNVGAVTMSYERQELDKFLLANGGELARPISLAILTDKGIQAQGGSTRDGKLLASAVDSNATGLRSIGRSTGFYGAEERFDLSLRALRSLVDREAARPGRKLLIWVSPGWPLLSGVRVDLTSSQQKAIFANIVDLSTRLRQANVTVYAVDPLGSNEAPQRRFYYQSFTKGIDKPSQTDEGDLGLQVLATQTGGLVLAGSNDIAALLQQAVGDGSAFYELTFTPSPGEHPDEYHQIEVKVDVPGLIVRTRQGYYTQPTELPPR